MTHSGRLFVSRYARYIGADAPPMVSGVSCVALALIEVLLNTERTEVKI
jgi:hypothetical protein